MKKCIFCGSKKGFSREHIIAQWIQDKLQIRKQGLLTVSHDEKYGEQERELIFNRFVEGRICKNCNNGWMSRLETENKEHIFNLMQKQNLEDEFAYLYDSGSMSFAKWAFKTAILIDYATNAVLRVPHAHFQSLYHGQIPKGVIIEIALTEDDTASQWRGHDSELADPERIKNHKQVYAILLQLKHLIIRVTYGLENTLDDNDMFEVFPQCGLKGNYRVYEDIDSVLIHCF